MRHDAIAAGVRMPRTLDTPRTPVRPQRAAPLSAGDCLSPP
jgi:hypothetical protein